MLGFQVLYLIDPTWSSNEMTLGWTISSVKWDTALDTESSNLDSVELTYATYTGKKNVQAYDPVWSHLK
jgi:hypothetical protein